MNEMQFNNQNLFGGEKELRNEKKGLRRLGYVSNLFSKDYNPDYLSILQKKFLPEQNKVTRAQIDEYIESDECKIEYLDENNEQTDKNNALRERFVLPFKDKYGVDIYGVFSRPNTASNFKGVDWESSSVISFERYGRINNLDCLIDKLRKETQNESIDVTNLFSYVVGKVKYLDKYGRSKIADGSVVLPQYRRFAVFETSLRTKSGKQILLWFIKKNRVFEGLGYGDKDSFEQYVAYTVKSCFVGRMMFKSKDLCNGFLNKLAGASMPEPWKYKLKQDTNFDCPILKSYLEYELERLFYEHEDLHKENKILFNSDKNKILFNTNLLDKWAHDLLIVGDIIEISGMCHLTNLKISESLSDLKQDGFDVDDKKQPLSPEFFQDINEIIFHSKWSIDNNAKRYTHIIEQRRERFPVEYQESDESSLSSKLDNAIRFAKKIAQRNYKFIVPMYNPSKHIIQLLMPIYLECTIDEQPDFALVLTPNSEHELYSPETILGLEEVYQDARLIAKPDESWLNPEIIK